MNLYNLKDVQARNDIISLSNNFINYVPKTGGSLSGGLHIQGGGFEIISNINAATTTVSHSTESNKFYITGAVTGSAANSSRPTLGQISINQDINNNIDLRFEVQRKTPPWGYTYNNFLYLRVKPNGANEIEVSDTTAWQKGLAVLPLSGGSLTGGLTTSLQLTIKDNTIDTSILPESNLWPKHLTIKDKDDTDRGYFELYQNTSGVQGVQIETKRIINNENNFNGMRLGIDSQGNRIINLSASTEWRNALGASNGIWPIELGGIGASTKIGFANNFFDGYLNTNLPTHFLSCVKDGNITSIGITRLDYAWKALCGCNSSSTLPLKMGGTGGNDSGWESLAAKNSDNYTGTIYYRKVGVFVAICAYRIKLKEDLSGSNITLLGSNSLPAPVIASSFPAGNNQGFGQIMIATNGSLNFYKETGTSWLSTRSINFTGMYMTA